ncbi:MAG: BatA and WFA domain-containing protein [Clostridia bacterium]|nr:BatA and WFA domain-containing protein [Clostridia bacterium]
MEFLNPWGLLGLLAVPALVALYILKQKHKTLTVPSLLLWKKTQTLMEASTPWQKLKKNLLFFIQLCTVILTVLALARPAFSSSSVSDEIIVIVDSSGSMQAKDGSDGKTRFDRALEEVSDIADGMRSNQRLTVITAGSTVSPVISRADSKYEVKRALEKLECGFSSSDIQNAVLLAESMSDGMESCEIIVYTDSELLTGENGPTVVNVSKSRKNAAILSVSVSGNMALSVAESFGEEKNVTLELLCDGVLTDARKVTLEKESPLPVYWKDIPAGASLITVRIAGDDILDADNSLSASVGADDGKRVLIVSESGFFLEKVISAVTAFDIYKATPENYNADGGNGYDLCIFDGYVPSVLPESVPCWFIGPEEAPPGIVFGSSIKGTVLSPASSPLCRELGEYMNLSSVMIARFREILSSEGWENAFLCGKYPTVLAKKDGDRALVTIAFDIHDSNLPLLKEFPILIQNMVSYSLPVMTEGDGVYEIGYNLTVKRLAYSVSTEVICPGGEKLPLHITDADDTVLLSSPGVYRINQTLERKDADGTKRSVVSGYVISKLPSGESAMEGAGILEGNAQTEKNDRRGRIELWPYFAAAVLLLLTLEWWVYYRENKL